MHGRVTSYGRVVKYPIYIYSFQECWDDTVVTPMFPNRSPEIAQSCVAEFSVSTRMAPLQSRDLFCPR